MSQLPPEPASPVGSRPGEIVRLCVALIEAFFLQYKFLAAPGLICLFGLVLIAWLLVPPGIVIALQERQGVPSPIRRLIRQLFAPKVRLLSLSFPRRWLIRATTAFALGLFFWMPIQVAATPDWAEVLFDESGYGAYDGALSADRRHLYFTRAHSRYSGISRLDLSTSAVEHLNLDDEHGHFMEVFERANLGVVGSRRVVEGDHFDDGRRRKLGRMYVFQLDPFELLATDDCDWEHPMQTIDYLGRFALSGVKGEPSLLLITEDLMRPCSSATPISLGDEKIMGAQEFVVRDDDPSLVWVFGEMGRRRCLVNPLEGAIVRCVDIHPTQLFGVVEPGTPRMWITRGIQHRVEAFDKVSGDFIAAIRVNGKVRPIAINPVDRYLYVGLYFGGQVAVIDLDSRQVVRYVGGPFRVRNFVVDHPQRQLYAIGSGGIYRYPMDQLHPRRSRPGT